MDAPAAARLVAGHLDLARRAAAMIYPRVREHVEYDELVALANVGLLEAASRFDTTKGVAFATFAWYRVQGAIIDGLRRGSNLPRRVWAKLVALRAASEYLENRMERDAGAASRGAPPPDATEALAKIKDAMSAIKTMYVTSLEGLRDKGFDLATPELPMHERMDANSLGGRMRKAMDALPDKERDLVKKHYFEGKNLLEAGAELGISKSWASRLHAQAIERLKTIVEAEPP